MNASLHASPAGRHVAKLVGVLALLGTVFAIQASLVLLNELEINGLGYLATANGNKELHSLRSSLLNVCLQTLGVGATLYWRPQWAFGLCLVFLVALTGITLYFAALNLPALTGSAFWAGSVLPLLLLSAAVFVSHRLRSPEHVL